MGSSPSGVVCGGEFSCLSLSLSLPLFCVCVVARVYSSTMVISLFFFLFVGSCFCLFVVYRCVVADMPLPMIVTCARYLLDG